MSFYRSEACFRRYENQIIRACLAYPKTVWFRTEGLSVHTDTARCRDAISSWQNYGWQSHIDPVAYETVLRDLRVGAFMGYAVIAPKMVWFVVNKHLRIQAKMFGFNSADVYEPDMVKAQEAFAREFEKGRKTQQTRTAPVLETVEKLTSKVSEDELQAKSIEDAVDLINSGEAPFEYFAELSDENISRVKAAIGDKLNAAFVVDSANNKIKIF